MSNTSVSQQATRDLIDAAASLARNLITRQDVHRGPSDTGERWVPLRVVGHASVMDALLTVDEGDLWTVIIYAPCRNGDGTTAIAVITGAYVAGRTIGATCGTTGDTTRHAQAAGEIRAFVATLPAVGQAAESEAA